MFAHIYQVKMPCRTFTCDVLLLHCGFTTLSSGKWWICVIPEASLSLCAVHQHTEWLVMALQDGQTLPLAGNQDSESPKPQGSNGKQ